MIKILPEVLGIAFRYFHWQIFWSLAFYVMVDFAWIFVIEW